MSTLVWNTPVMACCGVPRGQCRCGDAPTANAPFTADDLETLAWLRQQRLQAEQGDLTANAADVLDLESVRRDQDLWEWTRSVGDYQAARVIQAGLDGLTANEDTLDLDAVRALHDQLYGR